MVRHPFLECSHKQPPTIELPVKRKAGSVMCTPHTTTVLTHNVTHICNVFVVTRGHNYNSPVMTIFMAAQREGERITYHKQLYRSFIKLALSPFGNLRPFPWTLLFSFLLGNMPFPFLCFRKICFQKQRKQLAASYSLPTAHPNLQIMCSSTTPLSPLLHSHSTVPPLPLLLVTSPPQLNRVVVSVFCFTNHKNMRRENE